MEIRDILQNLGPLRRLAGIWEGDKGSDIAPSENRGIKNNIFRERITFVPFGPVANHEQTLYGLKYATVAFRLGEDEAFHEEIGYWLWDANEQQLLRSFIIPRGITILAGGTVLPDAESFSLSAVLGSQTYGICSNKFLDREFRTVRYDLKVTIENDVFSYEEDTQLQIPSQSSIFHHVDANTLTKVSIET